MAADKFHQLKAFLASLPETLALRLAKAVELDRLSEGRHLPHELILDGLRPVLRRALRVDRTPTPKRLFCRPFDDLLSSAPRKTKQRGRIARSTVDPVWNWLSVSLLSDQAAAYSGLVREAVFAYELREAEISAASFRAAAAKAMGDALSDETGRKSAKLALGGELALADADEMAVLLSIAPQISQLQEMMPKPAASMTDDVLWRLRTLYDGLAVSRPDAAAFIAVVAMNRLERPWEALRLPLMIARQTQDTLISSTDMGLVGELLLADLDSHAIAIRSVKPPYFNADELVRHIAGFTSLSNGLVKEVELRRDGKWGQRLMKDRAAVAEIMDDLMQKAPRDILAAVPTIKSGAYAGGPRVADLSRPFDPEKGDRARNAARLIAGCRPVAAAGSFAASQKEASDEVTVALKAYCEDILRELRTSHGERRERAEQYFSLAVELSESLVGGGEGDYLRRRGRAAITPQAAA
ncbi:MAG: hypothetical protein ABSD74_07840 [Rhizomicrobium sp.]|jgi:hypothetical protein